MGALEGNITKADAFFRGEDKAIVVEIVDEDDNPVDMDGWTLSWILYNRPGGTAQITKTTSNGIGIQDGKGVNSQAVIRVEDTESEDLDPGTYYHILRRTDSDFGGGIGVWELSLAVDVLCEAAKPIKTNASIEEGWQGLIKG